ncbi:hypothetical protein GCM10029992_32780 [Glycomyces albus]
MVDTAPAAPDGPDSPRLRIAMIGTGFMARAHSHAWRTAPRFFDLPLRPELAVIAGRDPTRTEAAAAKLGWSGHDLDWRRAIERDDIDLVDIVTPGTPTPRSPSPRSRPANTSSARSRWRTQSPTPAEWPGPPNRRPRRDGSPSAASATGGHRRSPSRADSSKKDA